MNAAFLSVVDCVFCVTPVCFVNASSLHCLPEALQTLSQDCPLPPRTQSCRLGGDVSCLRTRSLPMMAEMMSCKLVASLKMVYEKSCGELQKFLRASNPNSRPNAIPRSYHTVVWPVKFSNVGRTSFQKTPKSHRAYLWETSPILCLFHLSSRGIHCHRPFVVESAFQ